VAELLKSPRINLVLTDKIHNNWNALHKAILQDNVETVKICLFFQSCLIVYTSGSQLGFRQYLNFTYLSAVNCSQECRKTVLLPMKGAAGSKRLRTTGLFKLSVYEIKT
jgi:hypothetical protein